MAFALLRHRAASAACSSWHWTLHAGRPAASWLLPQSFSTAADGGGSASTPTPEPAKAATPGDDSMTERQRRNMQRRLRDGQPLTATKSRGGGGGGGGGPEEEGVTQLHPLRMFYPGQTYKPEELVHTPGDSTALPLHRPTLKVHRTQRRTPAANALLYEQADFRRPQLLSGFTSDTGKLLPRRTTKVAAKVQRAIVRAIKTARAMAILPYTDKGGGMRGKKRA